MSVLDRLLSYVMPRVCEVCHGTLLDGEQYICMRCLAQMPYAFSRPSLNPDIGGMLTNSAMPVGLVRQWYLYDPSSPFADVIRSAKYRAMPAMARELGRLFARDLLSAQLFSGELPPGEIDVLLPMPMYRTKLIRRGYNQAYEICIGMSEVLGIPVGDNLIAVKGHGTQTHLSHERRAANIRDCFAVVHGEELEGLNVAVVDDVITTGASMSECLLAISRSAGSARSVSVLALGLSVGKNGA